ncbi:MAG: alginate export family protein [Polyangiaceae bacterium]
MRIASWILAFPVVHLLGVGVAYADSPAKAEPNESREPDGSEEPRNVVVIGDEAASPDLGPPSAPTTFQLGDYTLRPTASLRLRGEYRREPPEAGGRTMLALGSMAPAGPVVRDAGGISERVRLGLGADRGPLSLQVTLQDARIWSAPRTATFIGGAAGRFGLYQAYFEAHTEGQNVSFFRAGRQAIDWGDGTLLSSADWAPTGRALDSVRGRFAAKNFRLEALAAFLEGPTPYGLTGSDLAGPPSFGIQLYGALARYTPLPLLGFELMSLVRVSRSANGSDGSYFDAARAFGERATVSARIFGADDTFRYSAFGAFQFGEVGANGASIAAWMAKANVEKTFDSVYWDPTVAVGGTVASGHDGGTVYRQFDPLLPDVHRFHGLSDLFGSSNIGDVHGSVAVIPTEETRLALEYRYLRFFDSSGEWISAYTTTIGRGATSTDLGHEIDLSFRWRLWKKLDIDAQYSLLVLGDGAKSVMSRMGRTTSELTQGSLGTVSPGGLTQTADLAQMALLQATLRVP